MLITSQSKGTKTIYINSIRIIAYYDTERLANISHLILKFKKKPQKNRGNKQLFLCEYIDACNVYIFCNVVCLLFFC